MALASAANVSVSWLGGGLGPRGLSEYERAEASGQAWKGRHIPIRELRIGKLTEEFTPSGSADAQGMEWGPVVFDVAEDLLMSCTHSAECPSFGAIQIRGDELEPVLLSGDWAIINRADCHPSTGLYAFRSGGGLFIAKTVYLGGKELRSRDINGREMFVLPLEELRARTLAIVGRVVFGMRRMSMIQVIASELDQK